MAARECPLCGGTMRLKESIVTSQTPGNPKTTLARRDSNVIKISAK